MYGRCRDGTLRDGRKSVARTSGATQLGEKRAGVVVVEPNLAPGIPRLLIHRISIIASWESVLEVFSLSSVDRENDSYYLEIRLGLWQTHFFHLSNGVCIIVVKSERGRKGTKKT